MNETQQQRAFNITVKQTRAIGNIEGRLIRIECKLGIHSEWKYVEGDATCPRQCIHCGAEVEYE